MDTKISEISRRIKALREILEISEEDMAKATDVDLDTYKDIEKGEEDFSFTFLFKVAEKCNIDMSDLIDGQTPTLSKMTLVRKGKGLPIERRRGFVYQHLAFNIKNRLAEPFCVKAPFLKEEQDKEIHLSTHEGNEFDYILKGSLKFQIDGHTEILNEGDSVFYDSSKPHGMIAVNNKDCEFIAVVIKKK